MARAFTPEDPLTEESLIQVWQSTSCHIQNSLSTVHTQHSCKLQSQLQSRALRRSTIEISLDVHSLQGLENVRK